jgi:hypothetical protein
MQPGDSCTVHAGTYREWVNPPRGGLSDANRITYQAAAGEVVYIKGSEAISTWAKSGSVWTAVVPNAMFGSFNPYSTQLSGDYLNYGSNDHLGRVYFNGQPYSEVLQQSSVSSTATSWYAQVGASSTIIWANFSADPSSGLVEINTRKYIFFPSTPGLGYITIEGFTFSTRQPTGLRRRRLLRREWWGPIGGWDGILNTTS